MSLAARPVRRGKPWLDLFLDWWAYAFSGWIGRSAPDDTLAFTCELGPRPYAIAGPDGNDLSDRWSEALTLRRHIRELWEALADQPAPSSTSTS
jgi:hypothetical protein